MATIGKVGRTDSIVANVVWNFRNRRFRVYRPDDEGELVQLDRVSGRNMPIVSRCRG